MHIKGNEKAKSNCQVLHYDDLNMLQSEIAGKILVADTAPIRKTD